VIRSQLGVKYNNDFEPVIQEAEELFQRPGEVWTDRLQAYRKMDFDYWTVVQREKPSRRLFSCH
jgi:hypothetical protein